MPCCLCPRVAKPILTPFSWGRENLRSCQAVMAELDDDQDRGDVDLLSELASIGQHLQAHQHRESRALLC